MDNQNLFSQTYNQIVKNALSGGSHNFQLLANPIDFNWPASSTGQVSMNAYQLMSCGPKFQSVGTADFGDASFFDNYMQVLRTLTFKVSPAQQKNLQGLQNEAIDAANKSAKVLTDAQSDYATELNNNGLDAMVAAYPPGGAFKDFYALTHWKQDKANAEATAAVKNKQYNDLVVQLTTDPTLQNILTISADPNLQNPPLPLSSPPPAGGAWCKVIDNAGNLLWKPNYDCGNAQQILQNLSTGTAGGFNVALDASNSSINMSDAYAGAAASVDAFFWSVNSSGQWSNSNISAIDNSVKVNVSVQSSTVVPINLGSWYNGGFMNKLSQNTGPGSNGFQFLPPWQASGSGSNVVFGQNGLLSARVSGLVVVYKKKVSISMQSATYNGIASEWSASTGISIGCFSFSGYAGTSNYKVNTTGSTTTVTIEDTSTDPQIIGLTLAFPGTTTDF